MVSRSGAMAPLSGLDEVPRTTSGVLKNVQKSHPDDAIGLEIVSFPSVTRDKQELKWIEWRVRGKGLQSTFRLRWRPLSQVSS